ncbi:NAD-dependent dehydratase [Sphingobacteriales bacterium UPWRP_1]|nr:hypothetical protein B6N25_13080 [Sphingobacteriales bacterium TSM_CSS]PSJ73284.1 NAD-dependent dehydratase [Sphingobacteriales bacterium UPWRP_1]
MYVITGATGNTGKPITLALLAAGKKVRIITRNAEKAQELADKGAEVVEGNWGNAETLTQALKGATAAYLMIPPDMQAPDFFAHQKNFADAFATAIEASGLQYAVTLSSVGAHLPQKAGVVQGLQYMESRLNAIEKLNVLHLRASYFMENILGQIGLIKFAGVMGSPVKGNLKLGMVATKDIATVAATRLLALDFSGKSVQYILGSRDVTYDEIAAIAAPITGKENLPYVEMSYADFRNAMLQQWGASESAANCMCEFIESLNAGRVMEQAVRNNNSTTPTSIEDFMQTVFAYLYSAG